MGMYVCVYIWVDISSRKFLNFLARLGMKSFNSVTILKLQYDYSLTMSRLDLLEIHLELNKIVRI